MNRKRVTKNPKLELNRERLRYLVRTELPRARGGLPCDNTCMIQSGSGHGGGGGGGGGGGTDESSGCFTVTF